MLQFDIHDLIFSIINFFVLVFILKKFLYKPVLRILDARKEEIQNEYRQAEEVHNEALRLKDEYTEELAKARIEAKEIISQASMVGEENKAQLLLEAREFADILTKKAQEEAELEKEKAKTELRDMVVALAVKAAEKILGKTIQDDDLIRLAQDFINGLGEDFGQDLALGGELVAEAEVRSAIALTPSELHNLEEKLAKAAGQKVRLINVIDPDLIGGIVVKIGDTVIDGSVTTQLSRLKEYLRTAQIAGPEVKE